MSKFLASVTGPKGRWGTLIIWIALIGLMSFAFPSVNKVTNDGAANLPDTAMSVQAAKLIKKEFPNQSGTPLLLVWNRPSGLTYRDLGQIQTLYADLKNHPLPKQAFIPPLNQVPLQGLKGSISKDGTTLVTPILMSNKASTPELTKAVGTLKNRLSSQLSSKVFDGKLDASGLHIRFTGPVAIATDATALFSQADVTLLLATVALVLILLILLYRSPLLAIIPLIGVGFAYGVINPLLGFLAKQGMITVDSQGVSIMTVLLFGAGTDYCLFLISKYRSLLFVNKKARTALQLSLKSVSGAIAISALTVVLSLSTLLFAHFGSFHRFAVPFSLAILIMGIAALTLIPALLAIFGRSAFFPFIPRTEEMYEKLDQKKGRRVRRLKENGKLRKGLGESVTRHPWLILITSLILLVGLACVVPQIKSTQNLITSFPKDMPSREGFDLIAAHFSAGDLAPAQILVNTEGKKVDLKKALSDLPYVASVGNPAQSQKNSNYELISLNFNKDPYDNKAVNTIPKIRERLSQTLKNKGINPEHHFWIGGETSTFYDTKNTTDRDFQVIVPIVILVVALLLIIYLRSVVAMIYLMLTVMLSYLSALGLGWLLLHNVMGITAISNLIPLYAFVFLVALGEDYNIFMVSRIWENRKTKNSRLAIANGVRETSSVITSAGLILAGTFAVLATLPIQVLLQFGIITALGVLLDTFIVRPLLVPAITTLLGRWAYWPGKLWKHKVNDAVTENNAHRLNR